MQSLTRIYSYAWQPHTLYERAVVQLCTDAASFGTLLFVGGAVRDLLLGNRSLSEIDLATSLTYDELCKFLNTAGYEYLTYAKKYLVLKVALMLDHQRVYVDIACFRTEDMYTATGAPQLIQHTKLLSEDVMRRDVTVNALYFNPLSGSVYDAVGGWLDLEHRLVRVIGDPDAKFSDDPLRMIRLCRCAATLAGDIESKSLAALQQQVNQTARCFGVRLRSELERGLGDHTICAVYWHLLVEYGIVRIVFPELTAAYRATGRALEQSFDEYRDNQNPIGVWQQLFAGVSFTVFQQTQQRLQLPFSKAMINHMQNKLRSNSSAL